MITLTAY